MEQDGQGRKDLFEPEMALHHGRVFKLMGDGLLAEFASVDLMEYAQSALAVVSTLVEIRARITSSRRLRASASSPPVVAW